MKRTAKTLVISAFCFLSSFFSFAQTTFQHSYGTKADELPVSLLQTADKGYALLGSTNNDNDGYLVKIDSLGNKIWSKEYGIGGFSNNGGNFLNTNDKGFLICDGNILLKADSLGNIQWSRYFGVSLNKLLNVPGGYIAAGYSAVIKTDLSGNIIWTNNCSEVDMMQLGYDSCFYILSTSNRLVKMDKNGNDLWSKNLAVYGLDRIYADLDKKSIDIFSCNGNGKNIWFAIDTSGVTKSGLLFSFTISLGNSYKMFNVYPSKNNLVFALNQYDTTKGNDYYHLFLFGTDSVGNIKWARRIGGAGNEFMAGILSTNDLGIAILSSTQNFSAGANDLYFIKTDSMGNSVCNQDTFHINKLNAIGVKLDTIKDIYTKITNPLDSAITLTATMVNDTNFNVCSCYLPNAAFSYNAVGGNLVNSSTWTSKWVWSFGDSTYDSTHFSPYHQYKDTGIYTVCLTVRNSCGVADSTCKVIDYQNPTQSVNNISTTNAKISVYPNPSNGVFQLKITNYELGIKSIVEVYNMLGQKVYSQALRQTQGDNSIDISNQPAGLYLYRVVSEKGEFIGSGKVVIQK